MSVEQGVKGSIDNNRHEEAQQWFQKLIQATELVGDLYSINYETARVIIHDYHREKVGGIPSLSFLIASRTDPSSSVIDFKVEDSSFILLRVMDSAPLPQDKEAERIRVETAQRISGESEKHWDGPGAMDLRTKNLLGFAGVQCRIIGTFFLEENADNIEAPLQLKFGSDISNYYPNRGLKVYKPNGDALKEIVNYIDPSNLQVHFEKYGSRAKVRLGYIRYASTNRKYQQVDDVPVDIYPADLLSQKTALFGMTRTGKSNTTKIIAKAVYELRYPKEGREDKPLKIGQIIFDPNGEYANENTQDRDGSGNPNALKNIWRKDSVLRDKAEQLKKQYQSVSNKDGKKDIWNQIKDVVETEVITYGILPHPNDPFRRLMKINFYEENNLQTGKEIIDFKIADQSAQYFKNFKQVVFIKPIENEYEKESEYKGQLRRYERRVLVYKALLNKAGFTPPSSNVDIKGMFNVDLRKAMSDFSEGKFTRKQGLINAAGQTLNKENVSWDGLAPAFEGLLHFMSTAKYNTFNQSYISNHQDEDSGDATGEGWAEAELESLLEMFNYSKAINLIGGVSSQHTTTISTDYAQDIFNNLKNGKLVIIDQSSGEPELNKSSATRIMWKIFKENQNAFRNGDENIPEILVYLEEAHNILPAGNDLDLSDVWVRTAKEGSKYHIGMIYATQEVSSIQKNILKNTANWFISHLNNTDETKELTKYYDFADFEPSIRRAQDKGFLRVKTLSNLFVIPVQVNKFHI